MSDLREVTVPVATLWTSPDAPRDVDEAAVRDLPDVAAWADSMGKDLRHGLHGRTDSQLLMGEPAVLIEERGDWSKVAAPWQRSSRGEAGYPGWVRTAHLGPPVPRSEGATAYVMTRSATCAVAGAAALELSLGTALWVESVSDRQATVLLPGEPCGVVSLADLRLSDKKEQASYDAEGVLHTARTFLGLRYLWGGTSSWGLDCSGLVHLAWRSHGVLLPRDASDQVDSRHVVPVALDDVRPGDLYFFARPDEAVYHVGFVTRPVGDDGIRWMLHAPEGGELIEDAPLAPYRVEHLVSAGRVER